VKLRLGPLPPEGPVKFAEGEETSSVEGGLVTNRLTGITAGTLPGGIVFTVIVPA
jgi:hypothetical protein